MWGKSGSTSMVAARQWRLAGLILCSLAIVVGVEIADKQDARLDLLHRPVFPNRAVAILDWFLHPIERNTYLRPFFIEQDLNDVAMLSDGSRIWAVGTHGRIITSADQGRTWQDQESGTQATLNKIVMLPFGRCGWAVGDKGTILKTEDAGRSWLPQDSSLDVDLLSIAALEDCRHAWIASGSVLLYTEDGGALWQGINGYNGAVVYGDRSVPLRDGALGGLVASTDGGFFVTHDAGADWEPLVLGERHRFADVVVGPRGRSAWAVDVDGKFADSHDGGRSWADRYVFGSDDAPRVAMADDVLHGVVVKSRGAIWSTQDGGRTWIAAKNPLGTGLNAVTMSWDGSLAVAVGPRGAVLASYDGGRTWFPSMRGDGNIRSILIEPDGRTIWAAADGPVLLKSEDRGESWMPQVAVGEPWLGDTLNLKALQPTGVGKPGWMAGSRDVFRSLDGGRSWEPSSVDQDLVRDLRILPDGHGWSVGESHGALRVTRDGGAHWVSNIRLIRRRLTALSVSPDGRRIWAVGRGPLAGLSEDGGATWSLQPFPTGRRWIGDIVMSGDGLHGCAVGDWGAVVTTGDGGRSWINAEPGTRVGLNAVAMLDDGRGWIVGNWGTLLATDDFGKTWREAPSPMKSSMTAITMRPDGLGFVGAFALNMARTTDGGKTWTYFNTYHLGRAPWFYAWTGLWLVVALGALFRSEGR